MTKTIHAARSGLLALGLSLIPANAWGQAATLPRLGEIPALRIDQGADQGIDLDVARRRRPAFDPVGVTLGNWRLFPSITTGIGADSNPFGVETNRQGDLFVQVEPSLIASDSFSSGELRLEASGRFARFADESQANETSYRTAAYGRYETGTRAVLEAGADFSQLIERRDSSGFPNGRVGPVRYLQTLGWARGRYEIGRVRALAQVDYINLNFRDSNALSITGAPIGRIDQDVRDSHSWRGTLRGEYEIGPDLAVFAQGVRGSIDYRREDIAPGVPNLTGTTTTALAGIAFGANRLIQGSVGAGYVWRDYDRAAIGQIKGFALNGDLRYFITPVLTLSAQASRTVEEAVLQNASGYISTALSGRADFELLRELILNVGAGYRYNDFRDNPRRDKVWEMSAGARYSVNRNFALEGDVSYLDRSVRNDAFAPSFDQVRIFVRTRFSL